MQTYELPNMGGNTISTKLTARILQELRAGAFSNSNRLPSELELAERYGVSRSVIRDVLSNLEREGFIERGRGVGTLVHREIVNLQNRLDLKYEYNQLILGAGCKPGADHLRLYETPADEGLAKRLEIEVGTPLVVCEKRVLASGKPVIYSIDHLPKSLFGGKEYQNFSWELPVFDILEEKCGIVVDTDMANLEAMQATPFLKEELQLAEEEALIHIDEIGYYKFSRPIIQTYGYYTNFFNFTMFRRKF